ncbi:MAG: radical SAM protein [Parvularculaceae bacterium]
MRRLRITIIDIVGSKLGQNFYARVMNANFASVMPQAIGVWCEELGHDVRYICFTGGEDITKEFSEAADVVFIGAFTLSAQLAYAISALYRRRGAVTVLGGPHARCYPEDAARYFDYVLGLTDKKVVAEVLADGGRHRPEGRQFAAKLQPKEIPGVKERWKFVAAAIVKAPIFKLVPMLGSTGCPYTCSFCIDSVIPFQTLGYDQMREDLRFLLTKMKRPRVAWHDPNFGVRFDEYLSTIEEVAPPGSIDFLAESSLSLLSEPHLKRLKKNSFVAILPGVESWYSLGNKSKSGANTGLAKVRQIADHVNTILRYIPFVQTNFVVGLDCDEGEEPFELSKRFHDLAPGAWPAYSLFTSYGRAAPMSLDLERQGRVNRMPFHFLNSTRAMNIRPKNYEWGEFFDQVSDLVRHIHSPQRIVNRFRAMGGVLPRSFALMRSLSSRKADYYETVASELQAGGALRGFFDGETETLPEFIVGRIRKDLGPLWAELPDGALTHDHLAYSKSVRAAAEAPIAQATMIPA